MSGHFLPFGIKFWAFRFFSMATVEQEVPEDLLTVCGQLNFSA
jgi:hypothetical protein